MHIQYNTVYFPIASTISRMLTCAIIFISLVLHCENAYRQNEKIILIIDHLFINKNPGPELRASMSELRDLVRSRPVNFHLANFFRLDYTLLISTASVVTTYSIILLQSIN
ncbi:hypothetical protein evm_004447 [Chilo suppressalis]|nr:hypothetical protein evm_004447 [Chilo suppressalis]